MKKTIYVIGAGPAGLTAAYLLSKQGHKVVVFESDSKYVGGLARTVEHKGFRLDVGGHRFFTKSKEVQKFWNEVLGDDFLLRKRKSRIMYKGKFLEYPLQLSEVFFKLNPLTSFGFFLSFLKVKLFPLKKKFCYETWVINNFGEKLYKAFFKSYTEKVWGRKCTDISGDWAAQRINGLSMTTLFKEFLSKLFRLKKEGPKTLIEEFHYPRLGPGMLWERVRDLIEESGGKVLMGRRVESLSYEEGKWELGIEGVESFAPADHIISTAPISQIFKSLGEKIDFENELPNFKYRDFLTTALMFKEKESIPDNWIYVHNDNVKVARIQNYKNWSPEMVPSDEYTCYGLEYFCQEGDELWTMTDDELFRLAQEELETLGIPFGKEELDYKVVRAPKAYPVYDPEYSERLDQLRSRLEGYKGLHLIGRNGMHRYNNQDHSIMTAMLVVENILNDDQKLNPWNVNQDAEYIEKGYGQ